MSLTREQKDILKNFQTEHNRVIEEQFAQILTEKSTVRLFFVNENMCFTDGRNIIIDPAEQNLFVDTEALKKAEEFLRINDDISNDPLLALSMNTRGANIHESLHIIFSNFNTTFYKDKRAGSELRKLVLSDIRNVIEDSFIEAAGCSLYDNLEHMLLWNRVALFCVKKDFPSTLEQKFNKAGMPISIKKAYENIDTENNKNIEPNEENEKLAKLLVYLNYMGTLILYPFFDVGEPLPPIFEYVEKTKTLFNDAVVCGNADKRDEYVYKIFDIIEPLIPDEKKLDLPESIKQILEDMMAKDKTQSSLNKEESKGKEVTITRKLFTDENDNPISPETSKEKLGNEINTFLKKLEDEEHLFNNEAQITTYYSKDFQCSNLHKNISLDVIKPKINTNLRRAYQNLVAKYQLIINSYSTQIRQFLKINTEEKEEKKLFGSGIDSKMLHDIKRRYWHKTVINQNIPDISFLFMVDGSGSMSGERMKNVISAMVILHEVLKRNNIQHSIVEHRALYDEKMVIHNILVDYNIKNDEKYNILSLKAFEGTREGFSLYWAEKHINKNSYSEYKVIIMISDGAPSHTCDDTIDYVPPVSIKDTSLAAQKIIKRGTNIIALSLDTHDDDECYQQLKLIYPHVISCVDMSKFTGQLLHVITKLFKDGF